MKSIQLLLAFASFSLLAASGGCGSSSSGAPDGSTGQAQCGATSECEPTKDCKVYAPLRPICGGRCEAAASAFGCHADADCTGAGANMICGTLCVCGGDGEIHPPHCIPGCSTNADCNSSEACNAMHHCASATCTQGSDCPANFACRDVPSGTCAPKLCKSDADCSGYCVNGYCSGTAGQCVDAVTE